MSNKAAIVNLGVLAALCLVGFLTWHSILGGASPVTLQPADPLVGQITQVMGISRQNTLLVPGQDFTLSTKYFDNNTWAVVTVTPLHQAFDVSTVVLDDKQGAYQLALGPGSAFAASQLTSLPKDVATYLTAQAPTYVPIAE